MRLYAKLLLMTLVFASFQRFAPPSAWGGELWFGVRCHLAHVLNDEQLQAAMVDEYYRRKHTTDDDARLNIEVEIRYAQVVAEEAAEAKCAARAAADDANFDAVIWPG